MTSSADGAAGLSYGWINHALIASGKIVPHFNAFGGEDRIWLGPEGGQYGLFFKKGSAFDLAHWQTPPAMDSLPFHMTSHTATTATFHQPMDLVNFAGTRFLVNVDRTIRLLPTSSVWRNLHIPAVPGVKAVAYQSENAITNRRRLAWKPASGLGSFCIFGQYNPGPETTIVIPFKGGANAGPIVNDKYFGKVPSDRLKISDHVIYFSADGKYRSKIGIPPARALPILGSYDAAAHVLTLVQYVNPPSRSGYVNSMWEIQKRPFGGDVVNSYNDGPPSPGAKPLGPFYELETSSPAAMLRPGARMSHIHRTIHLQGPEASLDRIARATLGTSLAKIKAAFAK